VLVVLDNAADAEQARPLVPPTGSSFAVVTSRSALDGLESVRFALEVLDPSEALDLLGRILGADRVAAEPDAAGELARLCAGLPLALRIAAANALEVGSIADFVERLRTGNRLAELTVDGDPAAAVRGAFELSYVGLDESAQHMFRLLGLVPGPDIGVLAAASLAGLPAAEASHLLDRLVRAHLLERTGDRYVFHDLLRLYAAELGAETAGRDDATGRLIDHYLHTAYRARATYEPTRDLPPPDEARPGVTVGPLTDPGEALSWVAAERAALMAVARQTVAVGRSADAWRFALVTDRFLDAQGHWRDWIELEHLALEGARQLGETAWQAGTHRSLGRAYGQFGRYDEAREHFQAAFDLYATLDLPAGEAGAHYTMSWLCELQGQREEALEHSRRALDLFVAAGHRSGEARTLNSLGWDLAQLGRYAEADDYCRRALALLEEIGDRAGQASTWDSIGYIRHRTGAAADAVGCFQRSLELYRETGDRYNESEILGHLGDAHQTTGNQAAAREAWRSALVILEDLGHGEAAEVRAKLIASG
jgi:tetratricopeptide (TPR) repeat protein